MASGQSLQDVQQGKEPPDFKTMSSIGAGVIEIRVKDDSGIYRVIYVAKYDDAIYVLHAFKKKTQKTSQKDIDIAKNALKKVLIKQEEAKKIAKIAITKLR